MGRQEHSARRSQRIDKRRESSGAETVNMVPLRPPPRSSVASSVSSSATATTTNGSSNGSSAGKASRSSVATTATTRSSTTTTHRDLRQMRQREMNQRHENGNYDNDDDDHEEENGHQVDLEESFPGAVAVRSRFANNNNNNMQDVSDDSMNVPPKNDHGDENHEGQQQLPRFQSYDKHDDETATSGHKGVLLSSSLPQASAVTVNNKNNVVDEMPIDEEAFRQEAEAAMLSKLTKAEYVDVEEIQRNKQRRRLFCWAAAALVVAVIVGAVVGVVLGTQNSNQGGSAAPQDDESFNDVDAALSFTNITDTANTCRNAIPILNGISSTSSSSSAFPVIITGSTLEATFDNEDPDGPFPPCGGGVTVNGAGVWYRLTGTGVPLVLSTCFGCSFDTQISVYTADNNNNGGSGCVSTMSCVAANDQRTNCGVDGSHFTFLAESGTDYLVYLHGKRRATGVFTLLVSQVEDNSQCSMAARIEDSDPIGQVAFFGSTKFAALDDSVEECNDIAVTSPGVWYVMEAQASRFIQARVDDFAARVFVYTGPSCSALSCVAASNTGRAMWTAQAGTEYYIFVHGDGRDTADFSMAILPGGLLRLPTETNDRCDIARPLERLPLGGFVPVDGTTSVDITNWNFTIPGCGSFVSSNTMGRWYSVVGNGGGLLASTCDTDSGFLAQVIVYTGTCDNLQCIDGGEGNCDDQGAVAWHAEAGVEYFVLVQGVDGRVGDYVLSVIDVDTATSNTCTVPMPIILDGISVLGSTKNGQPDSVGQCQNFTASAPSSYYSVQGTGGPMLASTCDPQSTNFAKIEVNAGNSCDSRKCLDSSTTTYQGCGNQMTVTWQSFPGETYLIQVYGSGSESFDASHLFTLNVEGIPENYECVGASTALEVGTTVIGSTRLSSQSGAANCGNGNENGVWYKIQLPQDETLALSACSSITNFDAKLTLFSGSDCGQLTCISSNNGQTCGSGSFLTWVASASQVYYVLVQGSSPGDYGNFEISLGVENNICDAPRFVNAGQIVAGTTVGATTDKQPYLKCFDGGTMVGGPSVWYYVAGGDTLLRVSTCTGAPTPDAQISVYKGSSCNDLTCISGIKENSKCLGGDGDDGVTWFAQAGHDYYILVHAYDSTDFVLKVDEVENNSCATSLPVFLTGEPESVVGPVTVGEDFADPCTGSLSSNQPGSWYSFSGTGGVVEIDVCEASSGSSVSSLSVYNQDCSNLTCEAFVQDGCSLTVDTSFGDEYSVLLSSNPVALGGTVTMDIVTSNDSCENAFGPLELGQEVSGSTVGATSNDSEVCGGLTNRGAGVWFTFVGRGQPATAFTCSEFTNFDTQLSEYTGDGCGSLTCIDARDDNCGRASWLTIPGELGVTYYILVSGKGGAVGEFVLYIS